MDAEAERNPFDGNPSAWERYILGVYEPDEWHDEPDPAPEPVRCERCGLQLDYIFGLGYIPHDQSGCPSYHKLPYRTGGGYRNE